MTPPRRIWALTGALAIGAGGLFFVGTRNLPSLDVPFKLEWWAVAAGFAIAEVLVVYLHFRRDTHSFSLSEIPLVLGLFFLRPDHLLLAMMVGTGVALAVHRRQPLIKLAFNLANLAFTTQVAILLFRVVVSIGDPLGLPGWTAALIAAIAGDLLTLVMITAVIWCATGTWNQILKVVGSGMVASFFNTCLALVTVTVVWIRPDAVWLPLVLAGLMVAAYRIYGSLQQKHESLEVLYDSARHFQQMPDLESVTAALLAQARQMFRADRVEVVFAPTHDGPGSKLWLTAADEVEAEVVRDLDRTAPPWARIDAGAKGLLLARPIRDRELREQFGPQGIRDAMIVPLRGPDGVNGIMLVGNRQSDVATFGRDDLKLFETFVNHASASLENARLIARLRRQAEDNQHQALHDALTDLPNRTHFRRQVDEAIRMGDGSTNSFAVLLMDLDRFKEVNDTLGHHNGDLLLQAVATRLRSTLRPGDFVARLGGDEFGILLPDVANALAAGVLADGILLSLAQPFLLQELTLDVGASIGVALFPDHGRDVDTLVQRADVAMYGAKGGVAGHEVYSPEHDSYSPARLALLGDLRRAIEDRELDVFYQPKVDLAEGRIVGAEALVRWHHPERGYIPADQFIPSAEHTGLLRPMTLYVLSAALEQCAKWHDAGYQLDVAVNLSMRNLLDVELPDDVVRLLSVNALPASALELEITETALIADPVRTHNVLQRLHAIGVGIAIDDYGTGYSSLSYLRQMPVNELKIDKSFVTGMATDANDALIVRSTIELGRNLGLRVVAEGVETQEVWDRLGELGCHVAQGYYLGRPMNGEQFLELLSSGDRRPLRLSGPQIAEHNPSAPRAPRPLRIVSAGRG